LWDGSRLEQGLAELDSGKNLLFVQDQRLNRGLELPFFGHPARTSVGFAAAIQRRPQRPVRTVAVWREGVGRHRVHFAPFPMPERSEDPAEDRRLISLAANHWYEEQIRARPWAWLWLHLRWK
ncbi:MAG TPA: lauroyl acyltransferase, partial [Myxococcota bacterium]|nr:lauroyl acyltransferase [Myxococcota bacterium]